MHRLNDLQQKFQKWRGKASEETQKKEEEEKEKKKEESDSEEEKDFILLLPSQAPLLPQDVSILLEKIKADDQEIIQCADRWLPLDNPDNPAPYSFNAQQISFLLNFAINKSYFHILVLLFNHLKVDINHPLDEENRTCLHVAAGHGQTDCVSYLYSLQNESKHDSLSYRPVHYAIQNDHEKTVFLFFEKDNLSVFKMEGDKQDPLEMALIHHRNLFTSICQWILETKNKVLIAKLMDNFKIFFTQSNDSGLIIKHLIDCITKVMPMNLFKLIDDQFSLSKTHCNLLRDSNIENGRQDILEYLEKKSRAGYHPKNTKNILDAAKKAAASNQLSLLKWFLKKRPTNYWNVAALNGLMLEAVRKGHINIMGYLLSDWFFEKEYFSILRQSLIEAVKWREIEVVRYILKFIKDKVSSSEKFYYDIYRDTFKEAAKGGHLKIFKALFYFIHHSNNNLLGLQVGCKTLLNIAVCQGHVGIVAFLLDSKIMGASEEKIRLDDDGNTIAHCAMANGRIEILTLLYERSASYSKENRELLFNGFNNKNESPFMYAISRAGTSDEKLHLVLEYLDAIKCFPELANPRRNILDLSIIRNLFKVAIWCMKEGEKFNWWELGTPKPACQMAIYLLLYLEITEEKPKDILDFFDQYINAGIQKQNVNIKEYLISLLRIKIEKSASTADIWYKMYQKIDFKEAVRFYVDVLAKQRKYQDLVGVLTPILSHPVINYRNFAVRLLANQLTLGEFNYFEEGSPLDCNDPYLENNHAIVKRMIYAYAYLVFYQCIEEKCEIEERIHPPLSGIFDRPDSNCSIATWDDRAIFYLCALLLHWKEKLGKTELLCIQTAITSMNNENPIIEEDVKEEIRDGIPYTLVVNRPSSNFMRFYQPVNFSDRLNFSIEVIDMIKQYDFLFSLMENKLSICFDENTQFSEIMRIQILGELAHHIENAFKVSGESLEVEIECDSITFITSSPPLANALAEKLQQNELKQPSSIME